MDALAIQLNNVRLCETVLSSVENAIQVNRNLKNHQDLSGEEQFSLADRVTFKYYVGRLRLSQHRITAVSSTRALSLSIVISSFPPHSLTLDSYRPSRH